MDEELMPAPDALSTRIEEELKRTLREFDKPPLSSLSGTCREAVSDFLLRKGKRLRPALFVLSYGAYADSEPQGLFASAIALELLHSFILIHDDIVDHSSLRGGESTLHGRLQREFQDLPNGKVSPEATAMILGDMLYALGIERFMGIDESDGRKAAALSCLGHSAIYTACGEVADMLHSLTPVEDLSSEAIAQTCCWKTAYYSFVCPMVTGAILAGAEPADTKALKKSGLSIGLAYQLRDDIEELTNGHGPNGEEPEWSDLRDGKRTLPAWYAMKHSNRADRARLSAFFNGGKRTRRDIRTARDIILRSGGVEYTGRELKRRLEQGRRILDSLAMHDAGREALWARTAGVFA